MDPLSKPPRWALWLFAAVLLAYAIFLSTSFAPVAAGSDFSGYMHSARLFTEGRLTTPVRPVPEITPGHPLHVTPLGFAVDHVPGRFDPTYPCGFPLHLAAAFLVFGEKIGTGFVVVGAALAAMLLCYLLARELGVSWPFAAAGALALCLSPAFVFTSVVPFSDTVATAWTLTAYYGALRSRRGLCWAVLCGIACSIAVLVRPSSIVALIAVPLLLREWRAWALVALGGIPGAAWLLFYQHTLYGSAFSSGYDQLITAFGRESFWPTQKNYGVWFPRLFPAALLALLLARWLPWRERAREVLALLVWFFALYLFYSFYDISQQAWWYLRFILPGIPALIVLGVWAAQRTAEHFAGTQVRRVMFATALVIAASPLIVFSYWEKHLHVRLLKSYQQLYVDVPVWLKQHCPPGSMIAGLTVTGAVYYYTDYPILRWDLIEKEDFFVYAEALRQSGRPLYATLLRDEVAPALRERMPGPGRWEKLAQIDICEIYRYVPPPG